jgi:hypothetical protein
VPLIEADFSSGRDIIADCRRRLRFLEVALPATEAAAKEPEKNQR